MFSCKMSPFIVRKLIFAVGHIGFIVSTVSCDLQRHGKDSILGGAVMFPWSVRRSFHDIYLGQVVAYH